MRKKYLSDYILEERTDADSGKIRRVPVYHGRYYAFCLQGRQLLKTKKLFTSLTVLCILAFLSALLVNAPCGHRWYVMFPLALMVFPLFYQAESCLLLYTSGDKLTREQRDKTEQRMIFTSAILVVFSLFSLAGHIVSMVIYKETWRDVVYLAAAVVIFASSVGMITKRATLKTEELPQK